MISYVDPDPHGSAFWKNYRIRILVAKKNEKTTNTVSVHVLTFNPNQSGMPADSKGVAVGILIPTDVGLSIPTPKCPSFCTVKNGKNA